MDKLALYGRLKQVIFGVKRERSKPRYDCFLSAPCIISERKLTLNGIILDISQEGLLWRETSTYILDRSGTLVKVCIEGVWHQGIIIAVTPKGYSIRFDRQLEDSVALKIATEYPRPRKADEDASSS